jgi:hypothetical protein
MVTVANHFPTAMDIQDLLVTVEVILNLCFKGGLQQSSGSFT